MLAFTKFSEVFQSLARRRMVYSLPSHEYLSAGPRKTIRGKWYGCITDAVGVYEHEARANSGGRKAGEGWESTKRDASRSLLTYSQSDLLYRLGFEIPIDKPSYLFLGHEIVHDFSVLIFIQLN